MDIPLTDCYAAIDIGASSGRVVIGYLDTDYLGDDSSMELVEIHRFENSQKRSGNHDCWKIDMLFDEIVIGLAKCKTAGYIPKTIGIDTWAVDYVLLDENDRLIGDAVAYRDDRTDGMYEIADKILSPEKVYELTGIQRLEFNTIYQLLALKRDHPEQLNEAKTFLMIPDYLGFLLTGEKRNEYTNASTTGLLNAYTKQWDLEILDAFGFPESIFLPPTMPGSVVGPLKKEIVDEIGYDSTLVLPATHDTGSAYLAVPARDDDAVFLSSGTWSLLGVENTAPITSMESLMQGFTNEGGFDGRFRYLKNIMGLWMIQSIRRELNGVRYVSGNDEQPSTKTADGKTIYLDPLPAIDTPVGFGDLIEMAQNADDFYAEVNVNDSRFLSPASMIDEIRWACYQTGQPVPNDVGELMRCVYISLAQCYKDSVANLAYLTGKNYTSINIVGGGCQDSYLNQITADVCGIPVFAGPVEGTSIGNLVVQMLVDGEFSSLQEARDCIKRSFDVRRYDPDNQI